MRNILTRTIQVCAAAGIFTCLTGCKTDVKQTAQPKSAAPQTVTQSASANPTSMTASAPAKAGVIRIKAGSSSPYTDPAGNVWQAEQGFSGGDVIERDASLTIANTKTPGLFLSEHYGMDGFSCSVPNGKYVARLYFAETYEGISGPGERVFSFNVQGREFKDFDVFAKAGGANRAYIETVPVEVTDGKFKITFTSNIENPQINAIELAPQN
jgi:hypothetical protein